MPIRDLGITKIVGLAEEPEKESESKNITGIAVMVAILLLIMIMRKFQIGASLDTIKGFDSYRSVLFAVFGFFLFLQLNYIEEKTKNLIISWVICAVIIVCYEIIYGTSVLENILTDLMVTSVVLIISFIVTFILNMISKDDTSLWF